MTELETDLLWNSYFYPGTDTLINNFDIRDKEELKKVEANVSLDKLLELDEELLISNDMVSSLKNIHKYIFEDIYPFAGKYRKVNIQKRIGTFLFARNEEDIDRYLIEVFNKTNELLQSCHSKSQFADILASLYTQLIYCHPFREGNGRATREFLREFSILKSRELGIGEMELDWSLINKKELNQNLELAHIYPGLISLFFSNALVERESISKK